MIYKKKLEIAGFRKNKLIVDLFFLLLYTECFKGRMPQKIVNFVRCKNSIFGHFLTIFT